MRPVLRLVVEIVLGLAGVAAILACVLAWRLAQRPLDVTWLLQREQARLSIPGASLHIGGATLAWEKSTSGEPRLDIRLSNVSLSAPGDGPKGEVRLARIGVPVGPLLLGRIAPRGIIAEDVTVRLQRRADGSLALGGPPGATAGDGRLAWPPQLRRLRVEGGRIIVHDSAFGLDWQAVHTRIDLRHASGGTVGGSVHADLLAGDVHATLDLLASAQGAGARLRLGLTPVNPADLARLTPRLSALGALDAPVTLTGSADLDAEMIPVGATLAVAVGTGKLNAGRGSVGIKQITASLSATLSELRLHDLRVALADIAGAVPAPVFTGTAAAMRMGHRVRVAFAIDEDSVAMADLGRYWPAGTGGGARPWLVQNVTAGRVDHAHVAGSLEAPDDLSDVAVTSLSGKALIDDATLWWLRPLPPLVHAGGHLDIEGPDALRVTLDRGAQDHLVLTPASAIRITGLEAHHQFGDIYVGLSGPLADALAILNHPRLKLLSRGHVDVVHPAGDVQARMTLHVPLEDRVSMDDIPIAAAATLTGIHLGGIVGGRDLDQASLALKVTGDGLDVSGTGAVAGIPAKLAMTMDFRAGPPGQVLQHLTADGSATGRQLAGAGAPASVAAVLAGGSAGLRVDYAGRRDGSAAIQVDADLSDAELTTPIGWSKPAGPAAQAGARVLLDHGRLAGVDKLHAEGPGLSIVSRAELSPGRPRVLVLDRFQLGRTEAHGRIGFPSGPRHPLDIRLSGPMLDVSSYLAKPATKPAPTPPQDDDAPGPPWSVDLAFDRVQLARGQILAPFTVNAASDGLHILHADAAAGAPDDFAAHVTPGPDGRHITIKAADAGMVLRAAGVADNLTGGSLQLEGDFADHEPGAPLTGTATLDRFQLSQAPAIGRLLQAMTLYGLTDALRGPGLRFSRMVAPFRWRRRVLHLTSARAFSASLGLTAQGDIDLHRHVADVTGTVVPAYFFNQLLGDLPVIGRIFSPEKGGGVFAARYTVRGPLANPKVGVNALSALTPGFLREGFGLFSSK